MALLYDQFGREIRPARKPESRMLAAAPITDSWREYVLSGLTPETLATIFREADSGDVRRQAELFGQMEEKDGHILGEKSKRQNVILDLEFKVRPAGDNSRDVRVAEFVEEQLDGMTDFDDVLVALQDAVGKGYSSLEIKWDVSEGQAAIEDLEFIEHKRLLFTDPSGILRKYPLLITDDDPMGIEIPAWKTVLHRYGGKSGHPTRSGIYRVCAWMYLFKNYSIKDWVIFCEVYGMPLRLGKYDSGASDPDKQALLAAISSLGTDAAGIISKSTEIEFVESVKGKATGDLYQALASFANRENSKAILGQTLSAEVGDVGSFAAAKTHEGVRLDLLKADGRALASTVRHQIIRPMVGFNFGWDTPVPEYEAVFEEAEDLNKKSEWVTALLEHNVEMPVSFVRREFNIPDREGDEPMVGGMAIAENIAKLLMSGRNPRDLLGSRGNRWTKAKSAGNGLRVASDYSPEEILSLLGEKSIPEGDVGDFMKPVEALLHSVESLGEFRERLLEAFDDMDPSTLGTLMARALVLAELSGRFDVTER